MAEPEIQPFAGGDGGGPGNDAVGGGDDVEQGDSERGGIVDPASLTVPLLNIVSTTDRIVPHATAPRAGERLELAPGHVGMVVGAKGKAALWEPLAGWLSRAAAKC